MAAERRFVFQFASTRWRIVEHFGSGNFPDGIHVLLQLYGNERIQSRLLLCYLLHLASTYTAYCIALVESLLTNTRASAGVTDTSAVVQNFLNSLKSAQGDNQSQQGQGNPYTTLPDLLPSSITCPTIDLASAAQIDHLLAYLPPTLLLLAQEGSTSIDGLVEPSAAKTQTALEALSLEDKKSIVKRVLHSPQFQQSLASLTVALRDGGLPSIGDALGIKLENGGLVKGGSMPLGGGEAVEAFVEGVKKCVDDEEAK